MLYIARSIHGRSGIVNDSQTSSRGLKNDIPWIYIRLRDCTRNFVVASFSSTFQYSRIINVLSNNRCHLVYQKK